MLLLAGPLGVLAAILTWAALLVLGRASIYWPWMPEGYVLSPGLDPAAHGGFPEALSFSMVTLATLGFGDVAPEETVLRLVTPVEALVGFGLLTASLTWVLSLYPVLRRMRALAEEVQTLEAAGGDGGARAALAEVAAAEAARIVSSLTGQLIAARDGPRPERARRLLPARRPAALARGCSPDPARPRRRGVGRRQARRAPARRPAAGDRPRRLRGDDRDGPLHRPGLGAGEAFRAYAEDHHPDRVREASSADDHTERRGDAPWTSRPPST